MTDESRGGGHESRYGSKDMDVESPHLEQKILRKARRWKTVFWISLVGVVLPPIAGFLGTLAGMVAAFDTMGLVGGSDPEELAQNISFALFSVVGGLAVSLLSLPIFVTSIVALYRLKGRQSAPQIA